MHVLHAEVHLAHTSAQAYYAQLSDTNIQLAKSISSRAYIVIMLRINIYSSVLCLLQVQRGAEDAKDAVSDAGDKMKSKSDSAADDSEGMLKKAQKNVNRAAEDVKDGVKVSIRSFKPGVKCHINYVLVFVARKTACLPDLAPHVRYTCVQGTGGMLCVSYPAWS